MALPLDSVVGAYNGFFFLVIDSEGGCLIKAGVGNNSKGGDARVHVVVVVYVGEFLGNLKVSSMLKVG